MRIHVFQILGKTFQIKKLDLRDYAKIKGNKVTFELERYRAEGLGNIAYITASGFVGLFHMETLVITPLSRDVPMLIADKVTIMGINQLVIELYDTLVNKALLDSEHIRNMDRLSAEAVGLKDNKLAEREYDYLKLSPSVSKIGIMKKAALDVLFRTYMNEYGNLAKAAPKLENTSEKAALQEDMMERFIEKGNPFVDVFKRTLEESKVRLLFSRFIFGVRQ
ncbi:MAG: hypothetical protein EOM54_13645 [Clostridia bacterium]|nr:hypothetical protein [Clostridia bacterium]